MPQSQHPILAKVISDSLYTLAENDLVHSGGHNIKISREGILDLNKNIAVVQWAQFIEHDLVKTVVRTMGNLQFFLVFKILTEKTKMIVI